MTPDSSAAGFRHFHDQLSQLKETLLGMSSKAEERTDIAVEALMGRDRVKAKLVIDGDADLNRLEIEVEQAAVELLALQQPMARDLRFIIGAIKVSSDLERVGDHAVNIAESALRLADLPRVTIRIPEIEVMARRARRMLG
jgi:Phosphate uptake regulator